MDAEKIQHGLGCLLDTEWATQAYVDWSKCQRAKLDGHPFDLDINLPGKNYPKEIYLVGRPNRTRQSVTAMIVILQYMLGKYRAESPVPFRLRIIYAQIAHNESLQEVYFELICPDGAFLCGAYIADEDEDKRLTDIFSLIGDLLKIPVHMVHIPFAENQAIKETLRLACGRSESPLQRRVAV